MAMDDENVIINDEKHIEEDLKFHQRLLNIKEKDKEHFKKKVE